MFAGGGGIVVMPLTGNLPRPAPITLPKSNTGRWWTAAQLIGCMCRVRSVTRRWRRRRRQRLRLRTARPVSYRSWSLKCRPPATSISPSSSSPWASSAPNSGLYAYTHSAVNKPLLHCTPSFLQILLTVAFLFFFGTDGFPRLFADKSEHIRF